MPFFGVLINMPSMTTTMDQMAEYSAPWFEEIWPYFATILGLVFVGFIIKLMFGAFGKIIHHKE